MPRQMDDMLLKLLLNCKSWEMTSNQYELASSDLDWNDIIAFV